MRSVHMLNGQNQGGADKHRIRDVRSLRGVYDTIGEKLNALINSPRGFPVGSYLPVPC